MGLPDQSEQNRNRLNFERNKYHFFSCYYVTTMKAQTQDSVKYT